MRAPSERARPPTWSTTAVSSAWGLNSTNDNTTTCASVHPTWPSCYVQLGLNWGYSYNNRTEAGENYIINYERTYTCCGWSATTIQQIPPYFNNTCVAVKGFNQPCEPVIIDSVLQALGAVGGVAIAVAILELFTIAITIYLIRAVPKGGKSNSDMPPPQEMIDEE